MKLKILISLLTLSSAIASPLRSQPKSLDSIDIVRLADYVNCELTSAYLENYVKTIQDKESLKEISNVLDKNNIDKPISNEFLKKLLPADKFTDNGVMKILVGLNSNKSNVLSSQVSDSVLISNLLDISNFTPVTQNHLQKRKEGLLEELKTEITKIRRKTTEVSAATGVDSGSKVPVKSRVPPDGPELSPGDIMPYVSLLIALGALALSIMAYRKAMGRSRHEETIAYERQKFRDRVDMRFDTLDRRTRTLESDFIELREKQRTIAQPQRMEPAVVVPDPPKTEPVQIASPWLFLSSFNEDGSFERSSLKSEYSPSTAKYKVKINAVDMAVAEFEFCGEGAALRDSLSNPDKYLKPLCRINPSADYNSVKRIVTDKRGKAELRGDKWIVEIENKAEITLL